MRPLLLVFLLLSGVSCSKAPSEPQSVVVQIEGMTCQNCVDGITSALVRTPGVRSCTVSLEEKRAVVEIDPAAMDPGQVARRINQLGFQATVGE